MGWPDLVWHFLFLIPTLCSRARTFLCSVRSDSVRKPGCEGQEMCISWVPWMLWTARWRTSGWSLGKDPGVAFRVLLLTTTYTGPAALSPRCPSVPGEESLCLLSCPESFTVKDTCGSSGLLGGTHWLSRRHTMTISAVLKYFLLTEAPPVASVCPSAPFWSHDVCSVPRVVQTRSCLWLTFISQLFFSSSLWGFSLPSSSSLPLLFLCFFKSGKAHLVP